MTKYIESKEGKEEEEEEEEERNNVQRTNRNTKETETSTKQSTKYDLCTSQFRVNLMMNFLLQFCSCYKTRIGNELQCSVCS
jgi:hypothetical protein